MNVKHFHVSPAQPPHPSKTPDCTVRLRNMEQHNAARELLCERELWRPETRQQTKRKILPMTSAVVQAWRRRRRAIFVIHSWTYKLCHYWCVSLDCFIPVVLHCWNVLQNFPPLLLPLLATYIIYLMLTGICSGWMRPQTYMLWQRPLSSNYKYILAYILLLIMSSRTSLNFCPALLLVDAAGASLCDVTELFCAAVYCLNLISAP